MDSVLNERWFSLSLVEQMINIGNEVKRAVRFDSDQTKKAKFLDKALEYTTLTMQDPKNVRVIPELQISKEVLEDYYSGKQEINCSKDELQKYYMTYTYLI
jgi:PIN domain nuclease of toxin-antitoxin system